MFNKKKDEAKPKDTWSEVELKRDVWEKTLKQAKLGLAETLQALEYQTALIRTCEAKLAELDE